MMTTTIRRMILILILLAIVFFIYRSINPSGADRLLDTTRNIFGVTLSGSVNSGTLEHVVTGDVVTTWTDHTWAIIHTWVVTTWMVETTGIISNISVVMKNILVYMWLLGSWTRTFPASLLNTWTIDSTGGNLTIIASTGVVTAVPPIAPTKPVTSHIPTKPVAKPVSSSSHWLSAKDIRDTQNLIKDLLK